MLFAALFSYLKFSWTVIFYVASIIVGAVAILWFFGMNSIKKDKTEKDEVNTYAKLTLSIDEDFYNTHFRTEA